MFRISGEEQNEQQGCVEHDAKAQKAELKISALWLPPEKRPLGFLLATLSAARFSVNILLSSGHLRRYRERNV